MRKTLKSAWFLIKYIIKSKQETPAPSQNGWAFRGDRSGGSLLYIRANFWAMGESLDKWRFAAILKL